MEHQGLLRALSEGRLMGAGLDVFEQEPFDPSSPLLSRTNVLATAHIAGVTDASYRSIAQALADNLRKLQAGEWLRNRVQLGRRERPHRWTSHEAGLRASLV